MPKFTVWQCDKCRKQVMKESPPVGWIDSENRSLGPNSGETRLLWCDTCWVYIKAPTPLESAGEN